VTTIRLVICHSDISSLHQRNTIKNVTHNITKLKYNFTIMISLQNNGKTTFTWSLNVCNTTDYIMKFEKQYYTLLLSFTIKINKIIQVLIFN